MADYRRLCLDHGLHGLGVHDGAGNCALLLWTSKPDHSPVADMAEYDGRFGREHTSQHPNTLRLEEMRLRSN